MDRYICIQEFYVDKYDEDGFATYKEFLIPKGGIWELSNEKLEISEHPCVNLYRVWKSKKAKTVQWIENAPRNLEQFFKESE